MSKFIEVTENDKPVWINIDHIKTVEKYDTSGGTPGHFQLSVITFIDSSPINVKETIHRIMQMINFEEDRNISRRTIVE
jgi:hypothetical protein